MKLPGILAAAGVALALGACAAVPKSHYKTDIYLSPGVTQLIMKEGKVNIRKDSRVNCNVVRPVGTSFPVTYCTTVAEAAKERERVQQMLLLATSHTHSN